MVLCVITGAHRLQSCMTDSGSRASISTVLFGEPKGSQWQDEVANLSRVNPRAAATRIRQTFHGHSRRDQSLAVRWPQLTSLEPSRRDMLDQWRQHFITVGAQVGGSFDEDFFKSTMRRFTALSEAPVSRGAFDVPFSAADLRVGADGLPYSLFKVEFPWWQTALLRLYNLALSWGTIPSLWKHSIVIPVFKQGDPTVAGNFRPISFLIHDRIVSHVSQQLHMGCRFDGGVFH